MKSKLLATVAIIAIVVPFVLAQQGAREQERQAQPGIHQPGQAQPGQAQPGQMQPGQRADRTEHMQGQAKNIDERYLKCSVQGNLFEEQAAKLVAEKAPDNNVKQFAQKLAQDHRENNQELKQIAQQKQMQVPNQMEKWQQAMLDEMKQLDPQTLQREFLFGTVAAHQKNILENKFAAQKIEDRELKTFATRTIPTLQQHLQQATQLTEQVTGIETEMTGVTGR